ncbi:MAG: hypothetical protein AAF518_24560 [Spirochaetota bacterium]
MEQKTEFTIEECVQVIKNSAEIILDEKSSQDSVCNAYINMHRVFLGIAGNFVNNSHIKNFPQSVFGKVLPATLAASTIQDALLNRKYTVALYKAIQQAHEKFPGERINIFYPLSGPYAHLVLPLAAKFSSKDISFFFLDVAKETLDGLWKIINTLGLNEYINQVFIGDPANHNHTKFEPYHILFTNSIQNTLNREPFLGMVPHLKQWLKEGGIVVPQAVNIEAFLYPEPIFIDFVTTQKSKTVPKDDEIYKLGEIFRWDTNFLPESLPVRNPNGSIEPVILPWGKFTIPEYQYQKPYLVAHTNIHLIEDIHSELSESGCTIPRGWPRDRVPQTNDQLDFFYYWGDDPQLVYTLNGQNPSLAAAGY